MSFPRYPEYKESGVEWLGEVPVHWNVSPLLGIARERYESNAGMIENNLLSLSYGRIVEKNIDSNDGLLPESFETYQIVWPNDIVFRLTDLQNDKRSLRTAIVEQKGIITSAYLAVTPIEAVPRYFHYLLRACDERKVFYSMGGGLRQSMKYADVRRLQLPLPSEKEQKRIAAFLDYETAKIDALVAEQEKLIALLKEKRQAVISLAVTKGLNPDAPMKDSGIEWLGEVPAHWNVTRLKYATSLIVDCPHETPIYSDDGDYLVIRTADIEEGRLDESAIYRVDETEYLNRVRRQTLLRSDIVYGREGERWGHAALVPEDNIYCLGQRMMQFRSGTHFCPEFLMWQLNAETTYRQGQLDTVGATSPHVNVGTIRNYSLTEPTYEEQIEIGMFLRVEAERFDRLMDDVTEGILLLKERRSALISAAVTGKIDVCGIAAKQEAA